jgi:hypothetical protein
MAKTANRCTPGEGEAVMSDFPFGLAKDAAQYITPMQQPSS